MRTTELSDGTLCLSKRAIDSVPLAPAWERGWGMRGRAHCWSASQFLGSRSTGSQGQQFSFLRALSVGAGVPSGDLRSSAARSNHRRVFAAASTLHNGVRSVMSPRILLPDSVSAESLLLAGRDAG